MSQAIYDEDNYVRDNATKDAIKIAKIHGIEMQLKENHSILQMLELHSDVRCSMVVKDRIFRLQKQLEELENGK